MRSWTAKNEYSEVTLSEHRLSTSCCLKWWSDLCQNTACSWMMLKRHCCLCYCLYCLFHHSLTHSTPFPTRYPLSLYVHMRNPEKLVSFTRLVTYLNYKLIGCRPRSIFRVYSTASSACFWGIDDVLVLDGRTVMLHTRMS